jgi:heterodisulfide reductase subunit C
MREDAVVLASTEFSRNFIQVLEDQSGTEINQCYQCGKCSAGCPAAFAMDYTPRQVIRMLQLDMIEESLKADSIWICATCMTCSTRCPRGVDVAALMENLRHQAIKKGTAPDRKVEIFNNLFLKLVEKYGRIHEMGLILGFNFKTKQFFKDSQLGLPMLRRGKLHLLPKKIKAVQEVQAIFQRVRKMEGEER